MTADNYNDDFTKNYDTKKKENKEGIKKGRKADR